jgi:GAF domain-containing protein
MAKPDDSVSWAIRMLDGAQTADEVRLILRSSARAAVRGDGATVVELEGDQCHYADEDAISPLWKGQRFPVTACISGWAIRHRKTVVIPDIRDDDRVPLEAYRPTFVRSMVMVPITAGRPVGAIGAYWGRLHRASDEEVAALESLADAAGRALQRILAPADRAIPAGSGGVFTG